MKKIVFFISLFCLIMHNAYAQPEGKDYSITASKIVSYFNAAQYDSIWRLFSLDMQNELPLEKTVAFFSKNASYLGKIRQSEFDHKRATTATYKLTYEKNIAALNFSLDKDLKINGLTITKYDPQDYPKLERNTTKLKLPFTGEWTVFWGGDTKELNYHVENQAQKNAFDINITDDKGKTYKTNGKTNDDYYCYGQPIIAPCDAEVVQAVDGVKENIPGVKNGYYVPGNSVVLKTKNDEFMIFAHFKPFSVKVKQGDWVKQGQLLGSCGNSGNSTEPHLHFHIQNVEDMNGATGVKCYFEKIIVNDNVKTDYSPIKGERIKNIN